VVPDLWNFERLYNESTGEMMTEDSPYYPPKQVNWRKFTDDDVLAYLKGEYVSLDRCRVGDGIYGYVDSNGQEFMCMDDDEERAERIIAFLQQAGTPGWSPRT
jgi:hypothetical protein